jgi:PilZ domain
VKEIRTISAGTLLRAISAGITGKELMRQFGLSQKGFHSVLDQLLAERQRRAVQILADSRSGMTVAEIAKKNGFGAANFNNILKRLEDLPFLSDDNCTSKTGGHCTEQGARDRRSFPRLQRPVLTTRIYEAVAPEKSGLILDLSETGICVRGIESQMDQEKTLFMNVGDFVEYEALTFECQCRWILVSDDTQRDVCAGFEITSISENSLGCLKTVLAAEIALAGVA